MPDVLEAAIIHRSKRLDPGLASCWPHGWRATRNDEGDASFRPGPLSEACRRPWKVPRTEERPRFLHRRHPALAAPRIGSTPNFTRQGFPNPKDRPGWPARNPQHWSGPGSALKGDEQTWSEEPLTGDQWGRFASNAGLGRDGPAFRWRSQYH